MIRKKTRQKSVNPDAGERSPTQDVNELGKHSKDTEKDDCVPSQVDQEDCKVQMEEDSEMEEERREREERDARLREVMETSIRMPKVKQHMVGYPM